MEKSHYIEQCVLYFYLSPDRQVKHSSSLNENVVYTFFRKSPSSFKTCLAIFFYLELGIKTGLLLPVTYMKFVGKGFHWGQEEARTCESHVDKELQAVVIG